MPAHENTASRTERAASAFKGVVVLSEDEQRSSLDELKETDPDLHREVLRLLSDHHSLGPYPEDAGIRFKLIERCPREESQPVAPDTDPDVTSPEVAPKQPNPQNFAPSSLRPGDRIGDFVVESFLARGGTSEVYRARQIDLGNRKVALKVLLPQRLDWRGRERFRIEAEITANLHHPHLVPVYGTGEDEERGYVFYAMRLVPGPTLRDVLEKRVNGESAPRSELRDLVSRALEVASAVTLLHENSLIHGDIKPANVVLEGGGSPLARSAVLVDLGLVRPTDQIQSTVWATPSYAAPEVLANGAMDKRGDVYSLGLMLHDLISGRRPESRWARPGSSNDGAEVRPLSIYVPDIDPNLEAVIAQATELEPERRYPEAGMLARDLRSWLEDRPVSARRIQGVEKIRRWVRRNPGRVLRFGLRGTLVTTILVTTVLVWNWGWGIAQALDQLDQSWQSGDLENLLEAENLVPDLLATVFAPEIHSRVNPEQESSHDGFLPVARRYASLGQKEALILAAAYVELDGLVTHRFLGTYLLYSTPINTSESDASFDALPLLGKIFTDRPDESPEDRQASRNHRARCVSVLAQDDVERSLEALSALSGCGTHSEIPVVSDWLKTREDNDDRLESWRLGLRCLQRLVERSLGLGDAEAASLALEKTELGKLADQISENGEVRLLRDSFWNLHRAINLVRRASGLPAISCTAMDLGGNISSQALAASGVAPIHNRGVSQEYGMCLALSLADAPESTVTNERHEAHRRMAEWGEDFAPFEEAFEVGRRLVAGDNREQAHDLGTHLGNRLGYSQSGTLDPVTWPDGGRMENPLGVAEWDCVRSTVRSKESGTGLWLNDTTSMIGRKSIQLREPGISRIRASFTVSVLENSYPLALRIDAQKSVREMLPHRGEAWIEVGVNGSVISKAHKLGNGGLARSEFPLSIIPMMSGERHEVSIRILGESTTQAWITRIEVVFVDSTALAHRDHED